MIVIPLPDPLDHHAFAQVGVVVPTPKNTALAPQEICADFIQSGISDVNPLTTEKRLWLDFEKCIVYNTKIA